MDAWGGPFLSTFRTATTTQANMDARTLSFVESALERPGPEASFALLDNVRHPGILRTLRQLAASTRLDPEGVARLWRWRRDSRAGPIAAGIAIVTARTNKPSGNQ